MEIIENQSTPSTQTVQQATPLRASVIDAVTKYFAEIGNQEHANVYELVLAEVEEPLLITTMEQTRNNQSKAAKMLGLSRGTLRKKLKIYDH